MQIDKLGDLNKAPELNADVVVVGSGPVGLTIARECARRGQKVVVVESGDLEETSEHSALIQIENIGELSGPDQIAARTAYHEAIPKMWCPESQPYGVACRGVGGSSQAWAGKSAPFDPIDFEDRPWVPTAQWPVTYEEIQPFVAKARKRCNLIAAQRPDQFSSDSIQSFYWQFARSTIDPTDILRFGKELLRDRPENFHLLTDATVTHLSLALDGKRVEQLTCQSVTGNTATVRGRIFVLAANAVENPRLLLASTDVQPCGIGNHNDNVGRYLVDHPTATIASYTSKEAGIVARRFGFSAVTEGSRAYMFQHGIALKPQVQRDENLLNAAVYFVPELSPDDPWEAFKRLIRWQTGAIGRDLLSAVRGTGALVRALGVKFLQHPAIPVRVKDLIINMAIRLRPGSVAEEFTTQGVPKKLIRLTAKAITEQVPDRDSRVRLSRNCDRFGIPLAQVEWKIGPVERRTLLRMGALTKSALEEAGFAEPEIERWVSEQDANRAVIIDQGHVFGTTRMSADPTTGVVDSDCKVFGIENLYIGGGSTFPSAGHTNPTLMFVAFAIRLGEHISGVLAGDESAPSEPNASSGDESLRGRRFA